MPDDVSGVRADLPITLDTFRLVVGREVAILYAEADGSTVRWDIVPKCVEQAQCQDAVRAFCSPYDEERVFLLSRIRAVHDTTKAPLQGHDPAASVAGAQRLGGATVRGGGRAGRSLVEYHRKPTRLPTIERKPPLPISMTPPPVANDRSFSDAGVPTAVPITAQSFDLLRGAEVVIRYADKSGSVTHRSIIPKQVTTVHGDIAVLAYCRLRQEDRTFLLRRMQSVTASNWAALASAHNQQRIAVAETELRTARHSFAALVLAIPMLFGGCFWAQSNMTQASVSVSGYTRSDGRRVSSYARRPPGARSHDWPYEFLRGVCLVALVAAGLWAGASYEKIKTRRQELSRLANEPPSTTPP